MKLNNRTGKIKLSNAVEKYLIHIRALNFASNTIYCYSKDLFAIISRDLQFN